MNTNAPTQHELESRSDAMRIAYNSIARWWSWWYDGTPDINGFQGVSFAMRDYADIMGGLGYTSMQIAATLRTITNTFVLPDNTPESARDLLIRFAVRNQPI